MVEEALVGSWIKAGERLTLALRHANFRVVASLWLYDATVNEWRLVIASPLVDQAGPLEAYRRVQLILRQKPDLKPLSLNDISVVSPNYPTVKLLRIASRKQRVPVRIRLSRYPIGSCFIDDACINFLA